MGVGTGSDCGDATRERGRLCLVFLGSTTTVAPTTGHTTTVTKGVDANGNEITKKDTYREGVAGSTESHTITATDPDGGTTTTRSMTTTKQE